MEASDRSAQPTEQPVPAARRDDLVVTAVADDILVYDRRSHRAHNLNRTAALVWRHCDGQRTAPQLATLQEGGSPLGEEAVLQALQLLGKASLLDGPAPEPTAPGRYSRQAVLRKAGAGIVGGAVMLPVVSTIAVPNRVFAASLNCSPAGAQCGPGFPGCCSGCTCSGSVCQGSCGGLAQPRSKLQTTILPPLFVRNSESSTIAASASNAATSTAVTPSNASSSTSATASSASASTSGTATGAATASRERRGRSTEASSASTEAASTRTSTISSPSTSSAATDLPFGHVGAASGAGDGTSGGGLDNRHARASSADGATSSDVTIPPLFASSSRESHRSPPAADQNAAGSTVDH